MSQLKSKTAIVTGGAGGIGAATARLFAREGANVLLVDVDEAKLREAAASAESDNVSYCVADVGDAEQTRAYVRTAVERYGGVDVLFANAGIEGRPGPLTEISEEDFDRVIRVNVRGAWLAIREAAPKIVERGGGSIMVTSSVAGLVAAEGLGPYVTSKHALVGLMRSAALELAPKKVRVNSIHPGPIDNRMMKSIADQMSPDHPEAVRQGFEGMIPLGRYGTNDEIAQLALFLASDNSSYCTGGEFVADGGYVSR